MSKKLERFGKYLLLDHILDGGMNRIFRARYLGDTASKICAIKVVLPQYSSDPAFKTMFMDEIKVTFGLLHPNIVQTYDYGTHQGQLYVAMEYCDGKNLKEYLDKLLEKKFVFPVEICTYITTQVCQGLHYAHTLTDKLTGKDCNIIHRDISPHNIMLTYDGAVKVIDFGIAKADSNSEVTQAGTLKGKLSYIAPEYLEGKDLNPRYDQFAVGITLWEMLCSRKLFKASNDIAVLKLIQECNVPKPSSINPKVPKELDEIVLKSLSKNPNDRFENLDQLNRAMIKFLYSNYPDFNSTDLSYFAKELFKEDISKDREKLFEFGKIDIAPYINDFKNEQSGDSKPSSKTNNVQSIPVNELREEDKTKKETKLFDFGFEKEEDPKKTTGKLKVKSPTVLGSRTKTRSSTQIRKVNGSQTGIRKESLERSSSKIIKPELSAKKNNKKSSNSYGVVASLVILLGGGFFSYQNNFFGLLGDKEKTKSVREVASTEDTLNEIKDSSKVDLKISLDNFDKFSQKAFLNNREVEVNVLGVIEGVEEGIHILRIEQKSKKHFIKRLKVSNSNNNPQVEVPELEDAKFSYLFTSGDCAQGNLSIEVYGESREESIPIAEDRGIALPLKVNSEGSVLPVKKEVYFKFKGQDLERVIELDLNREDQLIDLCEFI
jgi:eukaryotic-like serine/threonine-protein kinase